MCKFGLEEAIDTLFAPYYRALEVHSIDTKNANSANPTKRPLFPEYNHILYILDRRYIPEVEMKLICEMQAKRALSHCYQNVQNVSKQPNNTKFSFFVLFNQIAHIVMKNKF